jgi:hypothetical protein
MAFSFFLSFFLKEQEGQRSLLKILLREPRELQEKTKVTADGEKGKTRRSSFFIFFLSGLYI